MLFFFRIRIIFYISVYIVCWTLVSILGFDIVCWTLVSILGFDIKGIVADCEM